MTDWVRLWHDMPTDPKWRTIARKSGQRIGDVIAVFNFLMVNASANSEARGSIAGFDTEDVATALDLDDSDVQAILNVMQGKVIDGDRLTGWEKRQPKREDGTAAARKAAWKERQGKVENAPERTGTHGNAPETETETYIPEANASGRGAPSVTAADITKSVWETGKEILKAAGHDDRQAGSIIGRFRKTYSDSQVLTVLSRCQVEQPSEPVEWITKSLQAEARQASGQTNGQQSFLRDGSTASSAQRVRERLAAANFAG